MLRIIGNRPSPKLIELRLSGDLTNEDVQLLARQLHFFSLPHNDNRVVLNLDGVMRIDQEGLQLLEQWELAGMRISGGSPFIKKIRAANAQKGKYHS